jgi:flagellar protein FlaF
MAGGEVIGAAIGVLLLILVGYVLVGSTLTSAEVVATAQKDLTLQNEARLNTAIQISNAQFSTDVWPQHKCTFDVQNTGKEIIQDFNNTNIFLQITGLNGPILYKFDKSKVGTGGDNNTLSWSYITISPDTIHPTMFDPGETMSVQINNFNIGGAPHPTFYVTMTTANGVSAVENG